MQTIVSCGQITFSGDFHGNLLIMKVSYYLHISLADTIATRKLLVANSACMQSDQPAVDTGNASSYGCI